jgi:hypothetical protein
VKAILTMFTLIFVASAASAAVGVAVEPSADSTVKNRPSIKSGDVVTFAVSGYADCPEGRVAITGKSRWTFKSVNEKSMTVVRNTTAHLSGRCGANEGFLKPSQDEVKGDNADIVGRTAVADCVKELGGNVRTISTPYGKLSVCRLDSDEFNSYSDIADVPGGYAHTFGTGTACSGTIHWRMSYSIKSYQPAKSTTALP